MNDFETLNQILSARHSCRAFLPDQVAQNDIKDIVGAAQKVPSWCNAQPWQLHITTGAGTDRFRDALYEQALKTPPQPDMDWPKSYPDVYGERRRACGFRLYDAVGIKKGDRAASTAQMMENYRLFGAPHVAIVTSPTELGPYGGVDCGGFVAAFTIAAQAKGVATIAQAAIAAQAPLVRDHFGISDDRLILCAISFGYADTAHPINSFRTERASANDVIDWHDA